MERKVTLLILFMVCALFGISQNTLTSVSPDTLAPGYSGTFTVTGSGTNFALSTAGLNLRLQHVGSGQIYNFGNAPGQAGFAPGWNGMSPTIATGNITLPGNAPVGLYNVTIFGYHGLSWTLNQTIVGNSLLYVGVPPNVGYFTGKVVLETDSNCVQSVGENGLPNRLIFANPGGYVTATDANGNFNLPLPMGTYTISTVTTGASIVCPASPFTHTATVNQSGGTAGMLNFFMKDNHQLDLTTTVVAGVHLPGFSNNMWWATAQNLTTSPAPNVVLKVVKQSNIGFLTYSTPPSSVVGDTAYFSLGTLPGMSTVTVWGTSYVPVNTLGQSFFYTSHVSTSSVDTGPFNNSSTVWSTIIGSYDPNDKQVWTTTGANADGFIEPTDSLLRYLIRFQNTGTYTAFNIVVRDTFDADLDMSTLNITGSSHPYQLQIPDSTGRRIAFNFANIMLPDSNANEPGSHGWIEYKIRKKNGLANGTVISNSASIYFDFNAPVLTNTVNSKICPSLDSVFTHSSTELVATFQGPSGGTANGWSWNYGDGLTGSGQNPNHTYAAPGTYNVCLTVTNPCGRSRLICQSVTVTCSPMVAAFTSNQSAPLTMSFTQGSTGVVTGYSWSFGDGGTSTVANPSHAYTSGGTYTVCLIVTNACGVHDTTCAAVTPTCGALNAAFMSSSSGPSANFTNQSTGQGLSAHWDFGDGFVSTQTSPNHTYVLPGSYTVCLVVTDACGVQDSTCHAITVGCASLNVAFGSTVVTNTAYFSNQSAGSGLAHSWDFGDGNTSTQTSPVHAYALPGSYTVCLITTDGCATTDTTCHQLTVGCATMSAGFTSSTNALTATFTNQSAGSGISSSWDFGDGNTSLSSSPTHTYAAPGTYTVCLITTDACQAIDTSCLPVTVIAIATSPALTTTLQVLPNPAADQALLRLDCIQLEQVTFALVDLNGKAVQQWEEAQIIGQYQRVLDLSAVAPGIYFLQTRANGLSKAIKILVE